MASLIQGKGSRQEEDSQQPKRVLVTTPSWAAELLGERQEFYLKKSATTRLGYPSRIMARDGPTVFRPEEQQTWQLFTVLQSLVLFSLLIRLFWNYFCALLSHVLEMNSPHTVIWNIFPGRGAVTVSRIILLALVVAHGQAQLSSSVQTPSLQVSQLAANSLLPSPLLPSFPFTLERVNGSAENSYTESGVELKLWKGLWPWCGLKSNLGLNLATPIQSGAPP